MSDCTNCGEYCGHSHPEGAILTDLIAELRDQVAYYPGDVFPPFTSDDPAIASRTPDRIAGVASRHAWTRAAEMADRAEARLREVFDSNVYGSIALGEVYGDA